MIDSFVVLTPVLVLPLVALLVFVGCNWIYGLDETDLLEAGPGPTNLVAVPGNAKVALSWDPYPNATGFQVKRGEVSGAYTVSYSVAGTDTSYTDTDVVNETTYFYVVTAMESLESLPSEEVFATPTASALLTFITSKTLGSLVGTATGWFGMAVQIGASDVLVQTLGRGFAPGNAQIHVIKIVDANGTDVPGAFVSVNMAGAAVGQFRYGTLNPFVNLTANTTYYIVSQEIAGADQFYNHNTVVQTTNAATLPSAVRGSGATFVLDSLPNRLYGPVDFQY